MARKKSTKVRLMSCLTVPLEDGLIEDVTLSPLKVELPHGYENATLRVEIRNYDVYDRSDDSYVVKDEQGREYYQTLYFF